MKKLLSFTILFFLSKLFFAQPLNAPLRFTNYSITDGLPSNVASYFMQDSRGFLWVSTGEGLARFDGSRFTVYRHSRADSNSMPFNNTGNCIELKKHHLVFNSSGKMWMLNPFNHQQYAPPNFWKNKNYASLTYLNRQLIAISTKDKIYFTDMDLQVTDSVANPFPVNTIIVYLGNNNVLFCNNHKTVGYSLIEKKLEAWNIEEKYFGNTDGYSIKQADTINKVLYALNYSSGIFSISYNPQNPAYLKPMPLPALFLGGTKELLYNDGNFIISGEYQIIILQKNKPAMVIDNTFGNINNLPGGGGELFADNNDNIWITGHNGISSFKLNQLNYQYWKLPYAANIEFNFKFAGKIWMRSESHGSIYFDTKLQQLQPVDSSIISYCWGAVPVNDNIYIHGNGHFNKPELPVNNVKLLSYNLQTKKITAPSFLKRYYYGAELITMIYQSHNGDVWYSLNKGNGLVRQKANTNEFKQYRNTDNPRPFSFRYVNRAAEDTAGNIYFTVNKESEILVWKNREQHFEEWRPDSLLNTPTLNFGTLTHHLIDSKQNLWLAYNSTGLMQYNLITKKARLFDAADGLPVNVFYNITADAGDNIWMPTAKGLVCLLAATHKFLVFTAQDGLPFTNFFESSLFYDKDDSSLYFGNTGYLYRVKTDELLNKKKQGNISLYIDRMDVNNQPYYFTDSKSISLKPTENNLQFSFATLDFEKTNSTNNYEYSLTTNDDKPDWQKLNGSNTIAFNQLNPGSYYLQLRMLNEANNTYVYGKNSFHFTIATQWSKSWWFRILLSVLIALAVWAFMRAYYLRRIEKQKAVIEKQTALVHERSRIAADMHDDLGAGLSRIRYMSAGIKNEIKEKALKKDFDKIIKGSDELVDKMNEIIWALNSSDGKLEEVLYYIRSQCSEMLDGAGINLQATMPETIPDKLLSSEEKRNLFLVVKEAVHNIIKHAQATNVSLLLKIENNLQIKIADNGKGFNVSDSLLKGNGLSNYQKRMSSLKGKADIQSGSSGTTIVFEMPL